MINRTDLKRVRICVYVAWHAHMALASLTLPCHLGLFLVRWTHLAKAPSRGASADNRAFAIERIQTHTQQVFHSFSASVLDWAIARHLGVADSHLLTQCQPDMLRIVALAGLAAASLLTTATATACQAPQVRRQSRRMQPQMRA